MSRYVIGDIHGCVDELRHLIEALPLRRADSVVLLGDYIDRGPASAEVLSYLISLQAQPGGIEWIFLRGNHEDMFLSYLGLDGQHGDMFLINGGKATVASYGLGTDDQTDEEFFWIRNAFIYSSHRLPFTVLFGHTPQATVLYDLPYKVGLDTGLVYGNMLTCLDLDEKVLYQINRGKKRVRRTSVQRKWNQPSIFA